MTLVSREIFSKETISLFGRKRYSLTGERPSGKAISTRGEGAKVMNPFYLYYQPSRKVKICGCGCSATNSAEDYGAKGPWIDSLLCR